MIIAGLEFVVRHHFQFRVWMAFGVIAISVLVVAFYYVRVARERETRGVIERGYVSTSRSFANSMWQVEAEDA